VSNHLQLAEHVAETLDIGPGTRVFEVDCGDGAFLLPLYANGYVVGGTDGDPAMIERAIAAMPEGLFTVGMAPALDPAVPWDVVVCRSLSAEALAKADMRGLVARMFAKATHGIALLNVPEQHHRALLHALAEVGAKAVQFEKNDLFARV
jgi:2-polyprenyl-3-methyl-5-hydroxy-6-metoxy-1,4-benzoquinol methylase